MAITKLQGRTYDMLMKDTKGRVQNISPITDTVILIELNTGWSSDGSPAREFDNWEAARNWVRKAEQST